MNSPLSKSHLISAAAILTFILAWAALSHVAPAYAVPYWSKIFAALLHIPIQDVLTTVLRLIVSMLLSFALGLSCSLLLFERPNAEAFFLPLIKLLMAVPAVCWVVFAILWFKGVEPRIFFVMLITCAPVFTIDSLDGDEEHSERSQADGALVPPQSICNFCALSLSRASFPIF